MFKLFKSKEEEKLDNFYNKLKSKKDTSIGYPIDKNFDYSSIYRFLKFSLNNIGDPYSDSLYHQNTHQFEVEIIDWFADLLEVDFEYWGYVTNGGTEGNLYGLRIARAIFPNGIVYYSKETHYSVKKSIDLLKMNYMEIDSNEDGTINCNKLKQAIEKNKHLPVILLANIGTTIKGAIDDLIKINNILKELNIKNKYIHADCALSGMILPFIKNPQPFKFKDGVDSLAISGHKMIGSPIPCGIILTYKKYINAIAKEIEYIGSSDTTIMGSRNAITPLFLWYKLKVIGKKQIKKEVLESIEKAKYLKKALEKHGIKTLLNKNSITVTMKKPSQALVEKYELAPYHNLCHVITMPNVQKNILDEFVLEYVADRKNKF